MLVAWFLCACWTILVLLSLGSPFCRFLNNASRYGKLRTRSQTNRNATTIWSWVPSIYLHNGTCFLLYYAFACFLNTWLLGEIACFGAGILPPLFHVTQQVTKFSEDWFKGTMILMYPLPGTISSSWASLLCSVLMEAHVVRRLLECLYIHRFSKSKQHILVTTGGLIFYLLACLTPVIDSPLWTEPLDMTQLGPELSSRRIWIGVIIFSTGSYVQHLSHVILSNLRPRSAESSQRSVYNIPHGQLFEYVSCPHYFAECLIYTGFFVIRGGSVLQLLQLGWVFSNLVITATATHKWYVDKFDDYERLGRRILIPFVY